VLLPLLRTGRLDQAATRTCAGTRAAPHLSDLARIGEHVEFCALTGNGARGLEIIERHLDWLDRSPSPYASMIFTAAAGQLLGQLTARGHGDLTVRAPRPE